MPGMQISERRTVTRFTTDGRCDGVPEVLCTGANPSMIEPDRYKVMFWWTGPDARAGCRIEVLGHRYKKDGTLSSRRDVQTWDLMPGQRADIPDWLRLVVEVDLYKGLPDWGQNLWKANASGLTEVGG